MPCNLKFSMMRSDVQEFRKVYHRYFPVMVAFACRFVERDVAEDLVQDVFLSLLEESKDIDKISSFLFKTVQNKCLNYIKHRDIEEKYQLQVAIANERLRYMMEKSDHNAIYNYLNKSELKEILVEKLSQLPEKQYYACYKHFFEGYTAKELAVELNLSVRSVEGYFYTGISHLRKELKGTTPFIIVLLSIL